MEHSFNVKFAQKYGIEEAIIVHNFYFWLKKNSSNEKHLYDGRYWTYNSNSAFCSLFPYINKTKVFRVLKNLDEQGIILKGNFNTNVWDKTLWYSFSDKGLSILAECGYDVFDFAKMNHRELQSEPTIPYNKPNNKQEKEKDKSFSQKNEKDELFEQCWVAYKRKGSKGKAKPYWDKLNDDERTKVVEHIPHYVSSVSEIKFIKDFERYLKDKIFLNVVYKNNMTLFDPDDSKPVSTQTNNLIINGQIYK